jgi:vacuolar-type H+-ATPase subunit H
MKTFIIIKKDDLSIQDSYEAEVKNESSANRSHLLAEPRCAHVEMPEGADIDCLVAALVPESGDEFEPDYMPEHYAVEEDSDKVTEKLQNTRNSKLAILRQKRDEAIDDADNELKKHYDDDPNAVATTEDMRNYRIALRNLTDAYRYVSDINKGKVALDAFADDMSDFPMPAKPE